jgi:hypothetical protein
VIGTLRRVLSSALGVSQDQPVGERPKPTPGQARPARPRTQRRRGATDVNRRIDDARTRLKATIPPPED